MHFGFYLMIVALVLMGLVAIYALDQLATFVLQVPRAERYLIMSATIRRTGDARAALAMTPVLRRGGVYARPRAARGKLLRVHRDHQLLVEFAGEHDEGLRRVFDIQIAPIGTEHLACCAAADHHVRPGLDPMLVRVPIGMCADLARQEFHFMVTERRADTPRSAGYATLPMLQGGISQGNGEKP